MAESVTRLPQSGRVRMEFRYRIIDFVTIRSRKPFPSLERSGGSSFSGHVFSPPVPLRNRRIRSRHRPPKSER